MKTAKLPTKIDSFRGVYRFLSNFYENCPVKLWVSTKGKVFANYDGLYGIVEHINSFNHLPDDHPDRDFLYWIETYDNVENAYQAAKSLDINVREKFRVRGLRPWDAKKLGGTVKLRPDWDTGTGTMPPFKIVVMLGLLMQKFEPTMLRRRLLSTMTAELIEGNNWHDTYWGVCDGNCNEGPHEPFGTNHLGRLLMIVRGYHGGLYDGTSILTARQ